MSGPGVVRCWNPAFVGPQFSFAPMVHQGLALSFNLRTSQPSMTRAEHLLACTLTYRAALLRREAVERTFDSSDDAVATWFAVLMHEAREAMCVPLDAPPTSPYLHPVDVDTAEPGIVADKVNGHVLRCTLADVPLVTYVTPPPLPDGVSNGRTMPPVHRDSVEEAARTAERELATILKRAEKKAATAQRREERAAQQKEARARETPEERETRLADLRRKREERAERKRAAPAHSLATAPPIAPAGATTPHPGGDGDGDNDGNDESVLVPDSSTLRTIPMPPKRRTRGKLRYFQHPLPHHRHLLGLQLCKPAAHLLPALLHGAPNDAVTIVQGPPGTGKTRKLVRLVAAARGRVFLCAPTNVGAVNLYSRCVAEGLGDAAALVLAADRIPPGTPVLSNDPQRRIVCATVSARSGPTLMRESFENVFVDEAAQCMEAWVWTLLRADVRRVVLAGDVKQLPACVSESGRALHHERSLMERLVVDLEYPNVTTLRVQNRMAPAILAFPNRAFYGGMLTSGEHAPRHGTVEIRLVDGVEDAVGTSHRNVCEAQAAAAIAADDEGAVLISPYAAQVQLLLSHASGRQVHTVDSFQGREADTVVLSVVRDGSSGLGFWMEDRRLVVALTRARTRLVVVASQVHRWPEDSLLRRFVETHGPGGGAACPSPP